MVQALLALSVLATAVFVRLRRRGRRPARAVIVSPAKSSIVARDGAVYSVQSAELTVAPADLEPLWNPTNLENLARTYWRFLTRVTLGLIRVVYGADERSVVFLIRPFTLLRFEAPEYVLEQDGGTVRWRIRDGLLVTRGGRGCGYLALDVRREPGLDADGHVKLRIEVEVANFYPAIAASFSTPVYEATQSSIHVLVTHAFLRSLATLELAESRVRRLATPAAGAPQPEPTTPAESSSPAESSPAEPTAPAESSAPPESSAPAEPTAPSESAARRRAPAPANPQP